MKIQKSHTPRSGFTLVELLVVIAIIGLLAGLLFPAISNAMTEAQKTKAGSNMGQIAKSHYGIAIASARPKKIEGANTVAWAQELAKKNGMNSPAVYYAGAIQAPEGLPSTIVDSEKNEVSGFDGPVAYSVVSGVPSVVPNASSFPLLWTVNDLSGAVFSGTLGETNPWSGEGIHVCFVDGSVTWYDEDYLAENPFNNSNNPAASIPDGIGTSIVPGS